MARPRKQAYTNEMYLKKNKNGDIDNSADTQRNFVWKTEQINGLIRTVLHIPDIVSCGEECCFLCVFDDEIKWFILGWDYEDNTELSNKILHTYFPDYEVIEE